VDKLEIAIKEILRFYQAEGWMSTRDVLVKLIGEDAVKAKEKEWYSLD
jgi:hypothetical protein